MSFDVFLTTDAVRDIEELYQYIAITTHREKHKAY